MNGYTEWATLYDHLHTKHGIMSFESVYTIITLHQREHQKAGTSNKASEGHTWDHPRSTGGEVGEGRRYR